MDQIENDGSNSPIVACVFVAAITFLQSRCQATVGDKHRLVGGFTKYVVEIGSEAMIHVPSFIKIGSGI
jgi:hypothetical protein